MKRNTQRTRFFVALVTGSSAFDVLMDNSHQQDDRPILMPAYVIDQINKPAETKHSYIPRRGEWMN